MLVRVLARKVPNVGMRDDVRDIDAPSAKVLILLGKVEKVTAAVPDESPMIVSRQIKAEPIEEINPKEKRVTKKRTYKRRDMRAEK